MSGSELAVLMALLGVAGGSNDYLERNMHVLVVSASASRLDQIKIERNFANAVFFYGTEDAPKDKLNGSSTGNISLLNESDSDLLISAPFAVKQGVHSLTIKAGQFLETLLQLQESIGDQLYFTDQAGTPLTDIRIDELKETTLKELKLFLLPRKLKDAPTALVDDKAKSEFASNPANWENLTAGRSVMVYIASAQDMATRLAGWAPAMASKNPSKPTQQSWEIGAKAFQEHYQTMGVSLKVTPISRLKPEKPKDLGYPDFPLEAGETKRSW